ncbi:hypothetical protein SKUN_00539 [Spiroplasma kunkelii CR2-3x]|uniref:Uncharacterized protein n=1 Tax=Spiroplasma kunkelii CR2-3x TaxID=273035 RepID=A0A0K2JFR4_SPIKU|nr:hypothetical protein [Spiroplasma kunkelii]ALA97434.1 hypothetical protein SKUN_00539 [Spiroplasma kunkelii CR2-3x]
MKCQRINCNNKNAYFGNNYIEKIGDKLEWNLGYKKEIILCEEHWLQTYQLEPSSNWYYCNNSKKI